MRTVSRLIGLTLLIAFVLIPYLVAADDEKYPTILIEETRYEFGTVYEKKAYKHAFKVKNSGTADLEIKEVKPG